MPPRRARTRKARPADLDAVYLMGRDAWGGGMSLAAYRAACRRSPKYARGEWHLLEDGAGVPLASLIVYLLSPGAAGLGSIATVPAMRGKGLASRLIRDVLKRLDRRGARRVFLFADVSPRFYERFGFAALPRRHQKRRGSVCMLRGRGVGAGFLPPAYF